MCGFSQEMSLKHSGLMLLSVERGLLVERAVLGGSRGQTTPRQVLPATQLTTHATELVVHHHQGAPLRLPPPRQQRVMHRHAGGGSGRGRGRWEGSAGRSGRAAVIIDIGHWFTRCRFRHSFLHVSSRETGGGSAWGFCSCR